jgi:hypothetical protein
MRAGCMGANDSQIEGIDADKGLNPWLGVMSQAD